MGQVFKIEILACIIMLCASWVDAQDSSKVNVTINSIDSTSLHYFYIIKVTSGDSLRANIISEKLSSDKATISQEIQIGKSYEFVLEPIYEIVDKRHGKDSVFLSPATMRSVTIGNETLISSDYTIHPFSTRNLIGLRYIRTLKHD